MFTLKVAFQSSLRFAKTVGWTTELTESPSPNMTWLRIQLLGQTEKWWGMLVYKITQSYVSYSMFFLLMVYFLPSPWAQKLQMWVCTEFRPNYLKTTDTVKPRITLTHHQGICECCVLFVCLFCFCQCFHTFCWWISTVIMVALTLRRHKDDFASGLWMCFILSKLGILEGFRGFRWGLEMP